MPRLTLPVTAALLAVSAALALSPLGAQRGDYADAGEARAALETARVQQRNARARGERLERQAATARIAADKALVEAAALAARVQQSEAALAAAEARHAIAQGDRRRLEAELARERAPLARLVGAVETMARRPVTLAVFQPGSLTDLVHTRAILEGVGPQVERRTRGLQGRLARIQRLEQEAARALGDRRAAQAELSTRRRNLLALAEQNRLLARRVSGDSAREAARAMVLAEEARDLDALASRLADAGGLRSRLAALPGPVLRPADPSAPSVSRAPAPTPSPSSTAPPARYQLPAEGRIVAGFGETMSASGSRRPGISLAPRPGAQVVAPGAGRVAFAGPYRGYGMIVIVEHSGGWTSLVTGLGSLDVAVGQGVTAGSPLGRASGGQAQVTLELRDGGKPVNPLDHLR